MASSQKRNFTTRSAPGLSKLYCLCFFFPFSIIKFLILAFFAHFYSLFFFNSVEPMTQDMVENRDNNYPISGDDIRTCFLNFYASRGHKILPSASLVPDDPTVLLTIAGMLQFKPIFLGKVLLLMQFPFLDFFCR